jgi:S-adenosylmethionine:tRNA ribosyltransferase-isomerase
MGSSTRIRIGDTIDFGERVHASVAEKVDDGSALLHFHGEEPVELLLERAGTMPLPPYIAGKRAIDAADRDDYQTLFAREEGAVAAPTAALHFTPRLLDALDEPGRGLADFGSRGGGQSLGELAPLFPKLAPERA